MFMKKPSMENLKSNMTMLSVSSFAKNMPFNWKQGMQNSTTRLTEKSEFLIYLEPCNKIQLHTFWR